MLLGGDASAAQKVAGQWVFSANIMQCDNAIFGQLHLHENGEMVYLAGSEDLLGRGVGRWVAEGPVVGFELDIFQYTVHSVKHTSTEPHRFRGISRLPADGAGWVGDWYFCSFQQPPRPVGHFKAIKHQQGGATAPPKMPKAPEDCPDEAKKKVIDKLQKTQDYPPMMDPRWVPHKVSGDIGEIFLVRKWMDANQVDDLEREIELNCDWEHMATRDTQEFGAGNQCPCGRGLMREPLPSWQAMMIQALHALCVFHPVLYAANHVRINAYSPGQGIHPHLDGPIYFPRAAILTLGSSCVFDFYPRVDNDDEEKRGPLGWDRDKEVPAMQEMPPDTKPVLSLLLEPGSLLVFSGNAFVHHRHGIRAVEQDEIHKNVKNARDIGLKTGDKLDRGRRVSLTIRHLLPRCMCSGLV